MLGANADVVVMEPPFVEPSMPRPEVHRIARLVSRAGVGARVLDVNLAMYHAVLSEAGRIPLIDGAAGPERDLLEEELASSFFVEASEIRRSVDRGECLPGDLPAEVVPALRDRNGGPLREAILEAVSRLTGSGAWRGHATYVRDVELVNAALGVRARGADGGLRLTLHGCTAGQDASSSEEVLGFVRSPRNPFARLFDLYLGTDTAFMASLERARALIVVSEESQLVPGLALGAWLKRRLGTSVAITGNHIDLVMRLRLPPLAGVVDDVVAHRFEYGGPAWSTGAAHPFVHRTRDWRPACVYPALILPPSPGSLLRPLPGFVPMIEPRGYLSPLPLVGATVTSRCYWSKCEFCSIAAGGAYPFAHASPESMLAAFRSLSAMGVEHVQFLDYALPPKLFRALAEAGPVGIRWAAQARFERAFDDPGLFRRLAAAGCVTLCWGFETASERLLVSSRKGGLTDPEARGRVLRASADAGILNGLFAITGLPGETSADFAQTAEWLAAHADSIAFVETYPYQLRPTEPCVSAPMARGALPEAAVPPYGDWALDLPHVGVDGIPSLAEAQARADLLDRAFADLPRRSGTHDWLEGHLALVRTLAASAQAGLKLGGETSRKAEGSWTTAPKVAR